MLLSDNIRNIMLYCNIETLIHFGLSCKSIRHICDTHFWIEKFSVDDLIIITSQNNYIAWIAEYTMILRTKIMTDGILRIAPEFGLINDKYISIDIECFPNHESINFIPQELKSIVKANTIKGSLPYQLLINIHELKLIYEDCNNEDQDEDVFEYTELGSINVTLKNIHDILVTILYINEILRNSYNCNLYVQSEDYVRIRLEDNASVIYDELKCYHSRGGYPYGKWLSYWQPYLDEMF